MPPTDALLVIKYRVKSIKIHRVRAEPGVDVLLIDGHNESGVPRRYNLFRLMTDNYLVRSLIDATITPIDRTR